MKINKELILVIIGTGFLGGMFLHLSYLIIFDYESFVGNINSSTSKQKIYYLLIFCLNSMSPILRYLFAILQVFISYKLLKMCIRSVFILFKLLKK